LSARKGDTASKSTSLLPEEYEHLTERLRETANAVIPRNATVLVVSRGDDELLRIGPRRGLHFPQDEFGRYAGYHPHDSDAAIEVLESMRARGAEYLLLPSASFWWLDYYEGFRDHLERNYPPIVSADDCIVFELAATGVQTTAADADTRTVSAATSSRQLAGPLDELLRALLPADARIAMVTTDTSQLLSFGNCHAVSPPDAGNGLRAVLEEADREEAEFLVIPAGSYDRVHGGAEPAATVGAWRLVTRQRHLGEVYERSGPREEPAPVKAETAPSAVGSSQSAVGSRQSRDHSSANGEPRTANSSLWQRLRGFFQR
jgi:hypothetical protein